jgi:hypothetical protein
MSSDIRKGGHMKDVKIAPKEQKEQMDYEAPLLLGAEDLMDVAGGCDYNCGNGDCGVKTT